MLETVPETEERAVNLKPSPPGAQILTSAIAIRGWSLFNYIEGLRRTAEACLLGSYWILAQAFWLCSLATRSRSLICRMGIIVAIPAENTRRMNSHSPGAGG